MVDDMKEILDQQEGEFYQDCSIVFGESFLCYSNLSDLYALLTLRTFDVTHSRLVTHFRILKNQKKKLKFFYGCTN